MTAQKYGEAPARPRGMTKFSKPTGPQRIETPRSVSAPPAAPPGERGPFRVQGRHASDLEYLTYITLRRLGWDDGDVQFQVDVLGGHLPGGLLLDFVVWTPGQVTVVEPNGDYWHTATVQQKERVRQREAQLRVAWDKPFNYVIVTPLDLGMADASRGITAAARDTAYQTLLIKVGRG